MAMHIRVGCSTSGWKKLFAEAAAAAVAEEEDVDDEEDPTTNAVADPVLRSSCCV